MKCAAPGAPRAALIGQRSRATRRASTNTPADRLPGRCFDAALLVALLGRDGGFGFAEDEARVEFVDDIGGRNVEWTMGAAMALAHRAAARAAGKDTAARVRFGFGRRTRRRDVA